MHDSEKCNALKMATWGIFHYKLVVEMHRRDGVEVRASALQSVDLGFTFEVE